VDGPAYLGDIQLDIDSDASISMDAHRLFDLLIPVLRPDALDALQREIGGQSTVVMAVLDRVGIAPSYDPQKIELGLDIPPSLRATRNIRVASLEREQFGDFATPATLSAFVNLRGSREFEGGGDGGGNPVNLFVDAAARFHGVVFETQAFTQPESHGEKVRYLGSRLVIDDQANLVRWSIGDLRVSGHGFQSVPELLGISATRSYGVLQPQRVVRPTGRHAFRLDRPATVEIAVNGQVVRRMRLEPGAYDLRDFPFTHGLDETTVSIQDASGRIEILRTSTFVDQTQLAPGLSEFGLHAGVKAPLGIDGPAYSRDPQASGFYRRGLTDRVTVGANLIADGHTNMVGIESIAATPVGAVGVQLAGSHDATDGSGLASSLTFQGSLPRGLGRGDVLSFNAETRSRSFNPGVTSLPASPFKTRLTAGYSHAFTKAIQAGIDLRLIDGRGPGSDARSFRTTVNSQFARNAYLRSELEYRDSKEERGFGFRLTAYALVGSQKSARAEYDSQTQVRRLTYQVMRGDGPGSFTASAALQDSPQGAGVDATANFLASSAEYGVTHFSTLDDSRGAPATSRSALHFATSAAFADGAISIGRPIYDSFAIVTRHPALRDASVFVDSTQVGYVAKTGMLGTATHPDINSYIAKTIVVDAPDDSRDVDLGAGAYRLLPPFRSGYRLQVGSEYSVTVIGRLLDSEGAPIPLAAGTASEHGDTRAPLALFTNRDGRFGISGVRPGRWIITLQTDPPARFLIVVPDGASGAVKAGAIRPMKAAGSS
jgi:outer membrane usher protein